MAKYTSNYKSLSFYANDELLQFINGEFQTSDEAVIAVLDEAPDVIKEEDPEETPKPKKAPAKKASEK